MAHKRNIVVEKKVEKAEEVSEPKEMGWKDWLLRRYARSWYWVAALFLDIVLFFEVQDAFGLDVLGACALIALAIATEIFVYIKLWGKHGLLGDEVDDEYEE